MADIYSKLPINIEEVGGSASGASNPLAISIAVSGSFVDPRDVRALTSSDVVSIEGGNLSEVTIDITKVLGSALSASNGVIVELTDGTSVYDARVIRALTSSDVVSVATAAGNPLFVELTDGTNAISATNPLPVYEASNALKVPVHSYAEKTSVAKNASATHTYSVPAGKILLLKRILVSASGSGQWDIKAGTPTSEATVAMAFTSAANKSYPIELFDLEVIAADNVLVVATNTDNSTQNLYMTIVGELIDA